MVLGISSFSSFQFNLFNRQNVQSNTMALQRAGEEVATGKKADIYADLGPRAASVMKLHGREANTQTFITSNKVLGSKLDAMLASVDAARTQVQSVLESALVNATRDNNGAEVLQMQARAALESLVSTMNTSYNGENLFSGLESNKTALTRWPEDSAETGRSPQSVMEEIFGSGPTDPASAQAIADQIDAVFQSQDADASRNFQGTFYQASPEADAAGNETKQLSAWVNTGQEVVYGVRANEQSFRDAYKGLAMLAVSDVSQMDDAAYSTWMSEVVDSLSASQEGMLDISARIGFNQQIVEKTQMQLNDLSLVQRTQISNYESVDPYEAATRMNSLETQLQASYQVTSRLSSLSILNYLR
ncbi:flagellin [Sulfitobacter litoralis]|uniref:flagellin n=1 Tax=Sulfitobacter litoralis TaxID=335975 RepID=UPI002B264906|nr:flagellin [Sulfitobacter litoralis]